MSPSVFLLGCVVIFVRIQIEKLRVGKLRMQKLRIKKLHIQKLRIRISQVQGKGTHIRHRLRHHATGITNRTQET